MEKKGELKIPTMTAVPPNDNQQNTEQTNIVCHYCKKPGHGIRDCRKRMKKNRIKEMILRSQTRNLRHLDHLQLVLNAKGQIIFQKKCWRGPNATNRSKQFKQDHPEESRNDSQD